MSAGLKTPSRPPRPPKDASREAIKYSTNSNMGAVPARDSVLVERSPTLVGDSPPPRSSKPVSPLSTRTIPGQSAVPSDETAFTSAPVTPSKSARKKPICKSCGTPRKGHKRGQCPILPLNDLKSLYASSPENERTPTKASKALALTEHSGFEKQSISISAPSSATSAAEKRKQPHCRKCGLPMKGHKRPLGVLQCPVGNCDSTSMRRRDHSTSPTPSSRLKGQKNFDKNSSPQGRSSGSTSLASTPSFSSFESSIDLSQSPIAGKKHQRNITPTSMPARASHRSSDVQHSPILRTPSASHPSRSVSPNPPLSTQSSSSSISAYIPTFAPSSRAREIKPSLDSLCHALGEPEIVIYSAWNRDEVKQIRNKARVLGYCGGVVNVKTQERDRSPSHPPKADKAEGVERASRVKWLVLSQKEEQVRRCIDLCRQTPRGV